MNCVRLRGQQARHSGIRSWKRLAEALRDRIVRRCNYANLSSARWICVSIYHLKQGDINQINSKYPCYRRPGQTKDLASKNKVYGSTFGSYPGSGIENSDLVLDISVLLYLK